MGGEERNRNKCLLFIKILFFTSVQLYLWQKPFMNLQRQSTTTLPSSLLSIWKNRMLSLSTEHSVVTNSLKLDSLKYFDNSQRLRKRFVYHSRNVIRVGRVSGTKLIDSPASTPQGKCRVELTTGRHN